MVSLTADFQRPIVVFMTDGESSDVDRAAAIAGNVFAQRDDLITFAICLGSMMETGWRSRLSSLEPIVQAGNGGKSLHVYSGQKYPLLVSASARSLPKTFRTIASTVSLRESEGKRRLQCLEELRDARHEKRVKAFAQIDETYAKLRNSAKIHHDWLQQVKQTNSEKRRQLISEKIETNRSCAKEIETCMKANEVECEELRKQALAYEKKQIPCLEEELRATEKAHEDLVASLQRQGLRFASQSSPLLHSTYIYICNIVVT